jgi:arylsulfatase A-like enzyme
LDDTLVVITNDHGEMVGEADKKLGHGWLVRPELCNTPLIIMNPARRGVATNYILGAQVDVLPTVLDILRIPLPPGNPYEGISLYEQGAATNRAIYLTSSQQRAVIRGNRYMLEDRSEAGADGRAATWVFEISHAGMKTNFRPLRDETADVSTLLNDFERLQNSLILHYSSYRNLSGSSQMASAKKSGNR